MILGAGGSAKAIATILKKNNILVSVYNRTSSKLGALESLGIEAMSSFEAREFDLVIHATSVGLDGKSTPYVEDKAFFELIQRSKYVFDVIYPFCAEIVDIDGFRSFLLRRPKTAFVEFSQKGMDGLEMLLYQALYAFEIFCKKQYCFEELRALFYNSSK